MINIVEVATLGNQTIFIEKNKDGGFSVYKSMDNALLGIASPSLTAFYSQTELETMYLRSIRLNNQAEMSSRLEHLSRVDMDATDIVNPDSMAVIGKCLTANLPCCPFCGGKAAGEAWVSDHNGLRAFIRCQKCGCTTKTMEQMPFESKDDVIKAVINSWCMRIPPLPEVGK